MLGRGTRGFALLVFLQAAHLASAQDGWYQDLDTARAEAARLNRPILCHFYARWCAPCQNMERTVLNQRAVIEQLQGAVVGVKIDVDRHPDLATRFGVDQLPTDVFLEPDGRHLLRSSSFKTAPEYTAMIHRASTRYSDLVASRQPKIKPPVSTTPADGDDPSKLASQPSIHPLLDGYCPVTLWKHRRWVKGSPQFRVVHDGQEFYCASAAEQRDFQRYPDRYAPRFLGCDPVLVWETDRAVPGRTRWAAFYDEQLYLFASSENRQRFRQTPDKYTKTRVVLNVEDIETALR